jgi:recombinational DNA repair protein (RecF pathway)
MALACFEAVSQSPSDLEWVLRYFEVWLLKLEGFLPDLRACANCHKAFGGDEPLYLGSDLSLRCASCSAGRGTVISKQVHQQLRATEKLSPPKFAEETRGVPAETRTALAQLTYKLISRVLERTPRARPTFVTS